MAYRQGVSGIAACLPPSPLPPENDRPGPAGPALARRPRTTTSPTRPVASWSCLPRHTLPPPPAGPTPLPPSGAREKCYCRANPCPRRMRSKPTRTGAAKERGNRCAARPGHVNCGTVEPAELRPERGAGAGRSPARFPGRKCCSVRHRRGPRHGPVGPRSEGLNLHLALADEKKRHRLHPPRRPAARQLAPENRREAVAHQVVERAAHLPGLDQVHVDVPGPRQGRASAVRTPAGVTSWKATRCTARSPTASCSRSQLSTFQAIALPSRSGSVASTRASARLSAFAIAPGVRAAPLPVS